MSDECFSQRNYDHILKQLKDRAPYTLAFADFNEHFARRIDKQRNYVYCEGPKGDGDIYECLLFGDIASTDNGTINEAAGNYYVNQGKVSYIHLFFLVSLFSSPSTCSQSPTLPGSRMFSSSRCQDLPLKNWSIFSRIKS